MRSLKRIEAVDQYVLCFTESLRGGSGRLPNVVRNMDAVDEWLF